MRGFAESITTREECRITTSEARLVSRRDCSEMGRFSERHRGTFLATVTFGPSESEVISSVSCRRCFSAYELENGSVDFETLLPAGPLTAHIIAMSSLTVCVGE